MASMHFSDEAHTVSEGYILKLKEFHSILCYRAEMSKASERSFLLSQADKVSRRINKHIGQNPSTIKDFHELLDEKRMSSKAEIPNRGMSE